MATLRKAVLFTARHSKLCNFASSKNLSTTAVVSYWNKDWKPGPIPNTPEERAAAAKKYGLRPEDYDLLTEGELGDYPNLPLVAKSWKNPWEDYDIPGDKRNFGEPIHPDNDIIGQDLWDPNADGRFTYWQSLFRALMIGGGFLTAYLLLRPYPFFLPEMPKQYPFNDLYLERGGDPEKEPSIKHYTFTPKC
ncbi:NADH dehydrogenase [ubiquinone] 1 beta subcomplex subunit 8, mitochondrial [Aplysia californica]|uniref:NADH dehydrogenase [ubiquinone] 1 beta subcomplex subunit 8, mitochondrial n=1 Tax=Aplysia californica TaxID=6500 RepID=A0ABM0K4N6_APLCA|nr:NADH dehydrogenase [ubiquinone] 1 beta subcomplex subunit 8, mitochondrial [Aplysia californica]